MKVSRSARKTLRTGVRWKKGQSSSSNPRCQRFREAASVANRARVVRFASGTESNAEPTTTGSSSGFTKAALERHNKRLDNASVVSELNNQIQDDIISAEDNNYDDEDAGSVAESVETWATNFTGCTNQCFEKVLTHWADKQNLEARRSALAVLAAVAQLIRDRGGQETNEEYFQALLTALVSVDSDIRPAAAHLLSVLTRRMEPAALAPSFATLTKACLQLLHSPAAAAEAAGGGSADESQSGSGAGLPRSLLICLGSALASLPKTEWHAAATRQVLQAVLQFTQSNRPRIRKAAMQAVSDTLASTKASVPVTLVTAFALNRLNSASRVTNSLRLLRTAASYQTERQAKSTVEAVLALAPTADARNFSEAMLTIRALFWRRLLDSRLPARLIGQIVNALYDARPPLEDAPSTRIWLDTARAGVGALAPTDDADQQEEETNSVEQSQIMEAHLTKLFSVALRALGQSGIDESTRRACLDTCHHLLIELAPRLRRVDALASLRSTALAALTSALSSYQYYTAWPHVARLLSAFIRCHGNDCRGQADLNVSLTSLANLRDSADEKDANLCACLESALAAALETLGPTDFLAAVSLDNLDPTAASDTWRRSWLLPMLPRHIRRGAELAAFSRHLLPLAKRCQEVAAAAGPAPPAGVKFLELQVWQALPAFCYGPTDSAKSLPGMARKLGELLMSRPDIRLYLLAALRRLVTASIDAKDDDLRNLMTSYAKNYMPRLFALHSDGTLTRSTRLAALETIRCYARISPTELLSNWFDKAAKKIKEASGKDKPDAEACRDSADLLIAISPSLTDLGPAVDLCVQWCNIRQVDAGQPEKINVAIEKKGYRLAETLLTAARKGGDKASSSANAVNSDSNLSQISRLANSLVELAASGGQASPSSRKSRMRCLALCVSNGAEWLLSDERRRQLAELALPEAVLGSREQNRQAREAADSLLLEVFRYYAEQVGDEAATDSGNVAIGFLSAVFAAAGNDAETLQAALYSVTGLLTHLRHCMNRSLLTSLIRRLSDTMSNSNSPRTLVKAAIRCLASIVRKFGHAYTLEQVAECLEALPLSLRPVFRATVRRILTDLLASFPYETLRSSLPVFYHKQLTNVRKRAEHKERLKQQNRRQHQQGVGQDDQDLDSVSRGSDITRIVRGIDELLNMSSDSSTDADSSKHSNAASKSRQSRKSRAGKRSAAAASGGADSNTWLEEDADEILDLRDPLAAARIYRSQPPSTKKSSNNESSGKRRRIGDDFKLSSDGRLIIEESDNEQDDGEDVDRRRHDDDDAESSISGGASLSDSDEDKTKSSLPKYKPGGRGIHRDLTKKQPTETTTAATKTATKTKKKKKKQPSDGLDPYSYLTLDRRLLNRKNVAGKLARLGKYKNLVKAPRSGGGGGGAGTGRVGKAKGKKLRK